MALSPLLATVPARGWLRTSWPVRRTRDFRAGADEAFDMEHGAGGVQRRQAGERFGQHEGPVGHDVDPAGEDDLGEGALVHLRHRLGYQELPLGVGHVGGELEAVGQGLEARLLFDVAAQFGQLVLCMAALASA